MIFKTYFLLLLICSFGTTYLMAINQNILNGYHLHKFSKNSESVISGNDSSNKRARSVKNKDRVKRSVKPRVESPHTKNEYNRAFLNETSNLFNQQSITYPFETVVLSDDTVNTKKLCFFYLAFDSVSELIKLFPTIYDPFVPMKHEIIDRDLYIYREYLRLGAERFWTICREDNISLCHGMLLEYRRLFAIYEKHMLEMQHGLIPKERTVDDLQRKAETAPDVPVQTEKESKLSAEDFFMIEFLSELGNEEGAFSNDEENNTKEGSFNGESV